MVTIGDISEKVPIVSSDTLSSEVNSIFEHTPNLEGIVITNDDQPVGLVMKTQFYQKISTKYGFDLFMGRPIKLIMDRSLLVVDHTESITSVSSKAMNRLQKHLYDYVVVIKENRFWGIVSIKNLLIKLAEVQVNQAMYTNPLSGLPGNKFIEEKMSEVFQNNITSFSFLYIDLDHFKEYNDTYGFKKGDLLIKEVSNLLNKNVLLHDESLSFIGHIGGDDFVVILPHHDYEEICKSIVTEFDMRIVQFYHEEDWKNKYVFTKDRNGQECKIPLVSLSIAVITNEQELLESMEDVSILAAEVKKRCKTKDYSCFMKYEGSIVEKCYSSDC
ncbi:GGDEF domain-containing protein [Metabacillus schmidteae]|uniref:GGDEF domain-containing protein n=1 Tax=Metabacillus schmidteae TaxID=2730405 RepID=UPI001589D484|nr:GGDEF domain-containing protein [Metabacillus schmidteae]